MRTVRTRVGSMLLAVAMLLSLLPTAALATGGETGVEDSSTNTGAEEQDSSAVVQGSTSNYATIAAALEGGETSVTLTGDLTENVVIPTGKTFTIDLNGHKITNDATTNDPTHTITVQNGAELTINDSGESGAVDNVTHVKAAIYNEGTVTLNGGTFERSQEAGTSAADSGNNSWYTICNRSALEINDGVTVKNKGKYSSMICNQASDDYTPSLTINGGIFDGGLNTIKNEPTGETVILGGTFKNTSQHVILNFATLDIQGGEFTADTPATNVVYNWKFSDSDLNVPEATISGGTFTAQEGTSALYMSNKYNNATYEGGFISVTGGTFSSDVSSYVAENHECVLSGSSYTVQKLEAKLVVEGGVDEVTGAVTGSLEGTFVSGGTIEHKTEEGVSGSETSGEVSSDVTVDLTTSSSAASTRLDVTAEAATSLKAAESLTVKTDAAEVSFDNTALGAIANNNNNSAVTITVEKKNDVEAENVKAAYEVSVKAGETNLLPNSSDANGKVTISVPLSALSVQSADGLVAWYVQNGVYVNKLTAVTPAEGFFAFEIGHLSEIYITDADFESNAVASFVGEDGQTHYYDDLAEAVSNAPAGGTVTLLQDATVTAPTQKNEGAVNIDKNITIDGAGYTVKIADTGFTGNNSDWGEATPIGNYHVFNIKGSSTVTLKNLKVDGGWTNDTSYTDGNSQFAARSGINIWGGTVTLENVEVTGSSTYAVTIGNGSDVTITNLKTSGNRNGVNVDQGAKLTIGGAETNVGEASSIVYENDSATENGSNGGLTVNEGVYQNVVVQVGKSGGNTNTVAGDITLNGGEYQGTNGQGGIVYSVSNQPQETEAATTALKDNVTLNGGTYPVDSEGSGLVSALLKESGRELDESGEIVFSDTSVAAIGNQGYTSLDGAVEKAQSGDTVVLLSTDEQELSKAVGENVTLVIDNGQSVSISDLTTVAGSAGTIEVKAGGALSVGEGVGIGGNSPISLTEGSVKLSKTGDVQSNNMALKLEFVGAAAEVPAKQRWVTLTTVTVAGNQKVQVPMNVTLDENSTLTVSGELRVANKSTLTLNGSVEVAEGGWMSVRSEGKVEGAGKITNNGLVSLHAGKAETATVAEGQIVLSEGGEVYSQFDASAIVSCDDQAGAVKEETEGNYTHDKITDDDDAEPQLLVFSHKYTFEAYVAELTGLTVSSGTLNPAFDAATKAYTVTVSNSVSSIDVTPTFDKGKTVTVNGDNATSGEAVSVSLKVGSNSINIVVEQGAVSATYTVTVTRRSASTSSSAAGGGSSATTYAVTAPSSVTGGKVSVSPSQAAYGSKVTVTVTPDEGYELDALTVTDASGKTVALTDNNDGTYTFTMPRSAVSIEASFAEVEESETPSLVFVDVPAGEYYHDAVYWAVENGVTTGTTNTTFTPNRTVTRAEMVTFLWRAHGSPKPQSGVNPFTDLSDSMYYYDAVLWAVENGVTTGVTETTFCPDDIVTRAQAVTFQWRAAGAPAVAGGSFEDVPAGAYYAVAVAWAVNNGVTNGANPAGTLFMPETGVSRAQAVTFLWRELA